MIHHGFLEEMARLRAQPDLHADLPSMRCVGYRQAWHWLDHAQREGLFIAQVLPDLSETGIAATRQLAKRQLTWLRGMGDREVVACDAPDALPQTIKALRQAITERGL